ncbi:MAG: O-antigen ligase family protein [Bacillota bacterium]|nr:O-antigen ligase family protein [Bacillota bacterium]
MKWLKAILLFTLLFVEFQRRIAGVNISIVQLVAGIIFIIIAVKGIINNNIKLLYRANKKIIDFFIIYILGMFVLIVIHNYNNIFGIIKYLFVLILGFMCLLDFLVQEEKKESIYIYFNVLLIMSTFIVLFGIYEVSLLDYFPKRFDSYFWGISNRMSSRFLIILPIAFYMAKYKNKLYWIVFYILTLGILMTVSRGAIICVLPIFLIFNVKEFIKKQNILKTISGFIVNIFVLFKLKLLQSLLYRSTVLGNQFSYEIKKQTAKNIARLPVSNEGSTDISRFILWKKAISDFIKNPIFGKGIDKYNYYYYYFGKKVGEVNAHDWILHILAETGIVGLIVTLVLIVMIFKTIISKYKKARHENDEFELFRLQICFWIFSLFLIHNLVEASVNSLMFGYGTVSCFVLILLGICLGNNPLKKDSIAN